MSKTILHTYTQETKGGLQPPSLSDKFNTNWKEYLNIDMRRYTRGILSRDNELYIIESLGRGTYAVALIKDTGGRGNTHLSRVVIEANKKVGGADITNVLDQLSTKQQKTVYEKACTDVVTLLTDQSRNITNIKGETDVKEYYYCPLGDKTIEDVIDHYLPVTELENLNYRGVIFSKKECKGKNVIELDKKIITLNFPKDELTQGNKFKYEVKIGGKAIKSPNKEASFEVYEGSKITVQWSADGFLPTTAQHEAKKGVSLDLQPEGIQKKYTGEEFIISDSKPEVSIKSIIKGNEQPLNIESGTATITLADFPNSGSIEFELEIKSPHLWTKGTPKQFALSKDQFLNEKGIDKKKLDPKSYTIIVHRGQPLTSFENLKKLNEKDDVESIMSKDDTINNLQDKLKKLKDELKTREESISSLKKEITNLENEKREEQKKLEEAKQKKKSKLKKYLWPALLSLLLVFLGAIGGYFTYIAINGNNDTITIQNSWPFKKSKKAGEENKDTASDEQGKEGKKGKKEEQDDLNNQEDALPEGQKQQKSNENKKGASSKKQEGNGELVNQSGETQKSNENKKGASSKKQEGNGELVNQSGETQKSNENKKGASSKKQEGNGELVNQSGETQKTEETPQNQQPDNTNTASPKENNSIGNISKTFKR